MKELNLNEVALVSGGGNAGDHERHGYNTSGGVNGSKSNYPNFTGTVSGPGVAPNISGACLNSMVQGTLNTVAAGAGRNAIGFGVTAAGALTDIGRTCSNSSRSGPPFH